MPMELAVSTVASMASIALLHLVLWRSSPRPYLLWWAAAWTAFALRYSPALVGLPLQVPGAMIEFASVRDVCFIVGASLYAGRTRWRLLAILPALELVALATGLLARPEWQALWIPGRPALSAICAMLCAFALSGLGARAPNARLLAAIGYVIYAVNTGISAFAVFYEWRFLVDQIGFFVGGIGLALAELETASDARALALADVSSSMALALRGHVNVCRECRSIEGSTGRWVTPSSMVSGHARAPVTHGICPDCMITHFGIEDDGSVRT